MNDEDWVELEVKCMSTIPLCTVDNIINNYINDDSIIVIWDKYKKFYLAKSLTNKLFLKWKLYKLKMKEGKDLIEQLNIFKEILDNWNKLMQRLMKKIRCYCFLPTGNDIITL